MGVELKNFENGSRKSIDRFSPLLSINQRIWFLFLLPTVFCCIIYIADIATDIALVERHFTESRSITAFITILLIYAPPTVFFILTLRDEEKWPEADKNTTKKVLWILKQIGLLIFFPIHAIRR